MPDATMMNDNGDPHLFGIAKVDDPDTLRQMLGGWHPGIDTVQPQRALAGVDVHGAGFCLDQGAPNRDVMVDVDHLAYPVRVLVAATLPASQVKPPSHARPYSR